MVTKEELKKEFSRDWKKFYDVKLFRDKGFERKICKNCGKAFWTLDSGRDYCPEPPCENYSFIGLRTKDWDYLKSWKEFEKYFNKTGHKTISRYPTICRWRDDLYFTAASIVDFQRWEAGNITFEYPYDKLIVPQPSLRFNDIPNVGVTGRHNTGFVMIGQHAFGRKDYWKDECMDYNFEFLTRILGIPEKEITYLEDAWTMPDMSVFGPSIETFSRGLELVTNVFMQYSKDVSHELPIKVIDVGWGLERIAWFIAGTPTAYDVTFGAALDKMKKETGVKTDDEFFKDYAELAGALNYEEVRDIKKARESVAEKLGVTVPELIEKIEKAQALYAIADHTRTLLFAITDGGIPSNVGGGYNLRVILRRAQSAINEYDLPLKLEEIVSWHADYLKEMYPELRESLKEVSEIIDFEKKKFDSTMEKARKHVATLLNKTAKFDEKTLSVLYESYGITPELIEEIAARQNKKIEIPTDFYANMTAKHTMAQHKEEKEEVWHELAGLPKTEVLYYSGVLEFKANVLKEFEKNGKFFVVLDKTAFYPESGGQAYDTGNLDGVRIKHVRKVGDVIVHEVDKKIKKPKVEGIIDAKRRKQLSQHHTATHIVNGAARHVLGDHVWQIGAEKTVEKGRLDITHYDVLTDEQFEKIEKEANRIVKEGRKILIQEMPRDKAEQKYGFRLYQGGAVPSKIVRVIDITDWDVECCGGTHLTNTKDVEAIKIIKSEKKQDGVIRLEYVAGNELVAKTAKELEVRKAREKEVAEKKIASYREKKEKIKALAGKVSIPKENFVYKDTEDMKELEIIGRAAIKENPARSIILFGKGIVAGFKGRKSKKDVEKAVKEAAKIMGGSAGGKGEEFKGGGPHKEKSKEAFNKFKREFK